MATRTAKKSKKKAARRTTGTRKTSTRKASTRKATSAPLNVKASKTPRSKSDVFGTIAEHVGISKREVSQVFDAMGQMIKADLSRGGSGVFKVGSLMKVTVQRKPATKARKGINPFTGEPTVFKAKPARNVVKVRPLKTLKDMVA